MTPELLSQLNEAIAAKKRTCLARNLSTHQSILIIEDMAPDHLKDAVARAYRQDRSTTVEIEDESWFLQIHNPPLRLFIVGAVHISQALVPMAKACGFDVTIIDPRRAFADVARFPDTNINDEWPDDALKELDPDRRSAIVTLTHDPKIDDPGLDVALRSEAFYISALGSRKTHALRVERLQEMGHTDKAITRIHAPAGLDIGAVSPAEIAVSVMGQMVSVLRQKGLSKD